MKIIAAESDGSPIPATHNHESSMRRSASTELGRSFITFALQRRILCFGNFITKSGRESPYFFNAGVCSDGASYGRLCAFYAATIEASGLDFNMLFGPAYKGITLAAGTALTLAQNGKSVDFCYNRKEEKDHGETGLLIGSPLSGRVIVIDDVITSGQSLREGIQLIRQHSAEPVGIVIALDRQERGEGKLSAVQEIEQEMGVSLYSIANFTDILEVFAASLKSEPHLNALRRYQEVYGVTI